MMTDILLSHHSRGNHIANEKKKPSQKLTVEASLLKPSSHSLLLGSGQLTKSAVRFEDEKDKAAKDSYKRQKQAWDSPPDTPRITSPIIKKSNQLTTTSRKVR